MSSIYDRMVSAQTRGKCQQNDELVADLVKTITKREEEIQNYQPLTNHVPYSMNKIKSIAGRYR